MLRSPNEIRRAAERFIEQHESAQAGRVAVLMQYAAETPDVFAHRATDARAKLHHQSLLVVVCGPQVIERAQGVCVIEIPSAMLPLFSGPARYRCAWGGRGGARSWTFARVLIARSLQSRTRILCARELQNSIQDSIHALLADQIEMLGLAGLFEVQHSTILGRNGSEFLFVGLRMNVTKVKSLEGIDVCYVEQAESISENSWATLIPTVRKAGSEIYVAFNPDLESDPSYQKFVVAPPDDRAIVLKTSWRDNPWLPHVLLEELEYLRRVDDDSYQNIWEGACRTHSDAQVFRGKYVVESFTPEPHWDGPYHGLDLGFAADPSVLTKCWVADNRLFIEKEAWGLHIDTDRLPALIDTVADARQHVIRVDSSRPETVSFLQQHGVPQCESVEKWKDSIIDGINRMRAFEMIVIHPSCTHTAEEFRLYSYKTDRLTGDVLPDIIAKNDHCIDSIRYGIAPLIRSGGAASYLSWLASSRAQEKKRATPEGQAAEQAKIKARADTAAKEALKGRPSMIEQAKRKGGIVTPIGEP